MTGALCDGFRNAAAATAEAYGRGRLVGIVPWETTFTDMLLLSVATAFPGRVIAQRFAAPTEAATGADWQWWFKDDTGYAGMRVQAKRRDPSTGSLGLRAMAPPPPTERQARRLVDAAAADGLPAFYCFYSYRPPQGAGAASTGPCPHGPLDAAQWGASLLLGSAAVRAAEAPGRLSRAREETLAATATPLWRAVCPGHASDSQGTVLAVRAFIFRSVGVAFAENQARATDGADDGMDGEGLALDVVVGAQPPDDVEQAFSTASLAEVRPGPGLDGMALFDASGRT